MHRIKRETASVLLRAVAALRPSSSLPRRLQTARARRDKGDVKLFDVLQEKLRVSREQG